MKSLNLRILRNESEQMNISGFYAGPQTFNNFGPISEYYKNFGMPLYSSFLNFSKMTHKSHNSYRNNDYTLNIIDSYSYMNKVLQYFLLLSVIY